MVLDILKMVAYFKVYGLDIYGLKYQGYDAGKDNLVWYFNMKKGWTKVRINKTLKELVDNDIVMRRKADVGSRLYSLSSMHKLQLFLILKDKLK